MKIKLPPYSFAVVRCSYCQKFLGLKFARWNRFKLKHGETVVTHGVCKICEKKLMDKIESLKHTVDIFCPKCETIREMEYDGIWAVCGTCGQEMERNENGKWEQMKP